MSGTSSILPVFLDFTHSGLSRAAGLTYPSSPRADWNAAAMYRVMRSQVSEVPIAALICDTRSMRSAMTVADKLTGPSDWRPCVIALVVEAREGAADASDIRALHATCTSVIVGTEGELCAAAHALVGLCSHRGWIAVHPEDVANLLRAGGIFRAGTATGTRADIGRLAAQASECADSLDSRYVLVHLEVSDADNVLFDLNNVVEQATGDPPDPNGVVWAYTVRAAAECRVTIFAACLRNCSVESTEPPP